MFHKKAVNVDHLKFSSQSQCESKLTEIQKSASEVTALLNRTPNKLCVKEVVKKVAVKGGKKASNVRSLK
jgi:hypothetical protein